jgi:hypothetical protein
VLVRVGLRLVSGDGLVFAVGPESVGKPVLLLRPGMLCCSPQCARGNNTALDYPQLDIEYRLLDVFVMMFVRSCQCFYMEVHRGLHMLCRVHNFRLFVL